VNRLVNAKVWDGTQWVLASDGKVQATGGTVTNIFVDGDPYRVHTFTTSGDLVVSRGGEVEYLIVAGGGGGGGRFRGGGGGGGGLLTNVGSTLLSVSAGTISVTVGAGGIRGSNTAAVDGLQGGASSIGTLVTTVGGGFGSATGVGGAGGSGGGAGGTTSLTAGGASTAGQGNDGGRNFFASSANSGAGGGGGAGQTVEALVRVRLMARTG
jgi:hypothetical protein